MAQLFAVKKGSHILWVFHAPSKIKTLWLLFNQTETTYPEMISGHKHEVLLDSFAMPNLQLYTVTVRS